MSSRVANWRRRGQIFVAAGDEQSRPGRPVTDTHSWTSTRCRRRQVRFYGDVRQRAAARPVGPFHDRRGAGCTLLQSIWLEFLYVSLMAVV